MNQRRVSKQHAVLRCVLCVGAALGMAGCMTQAMRGKPSAELSSSKLAQEQFGPALRLARASRANGDFASAINIYGSITAIKPADPAVMVEFADTLVDAGSIDDAIDVYLRVDHNASPWLGALLGLQQAYLALGEPDKALQFGDQAVMLAPSDHRSLVGRGVTLDILGRHAQAQESYRAVLAGAPHNIAARNNLALSLALSGQFGEAIDIMTPMAMSSTATPRIRQDLALIYGLAGDASRAGALSRVDLDAATTAQNLRFFEFARGIEDSKPSHSGR